jgi:hypothetical protein
MTEVPGVLIRLHPDRGMQFIRIESEESILSHEVANNNLRKLSLRDLEHLVVSNLIIDLPELRVLFADYFWSDDGETPPRFSEPDMPR